MCVSQCYWSDVGSHFKFCKYCLVFERIAKEYNIAHYQYMFSLTISVNNGKLTTTAYMQLIM